VHYSAGVEIRPIERLLVDVTGFYKDLRELVSRTDAVAGNGEAARPLNFDNGGVGRAYGLELLVRRDLTDRFSGWLSYTLSRSERLDSGAGEYRPFDFDQTHVLNSERLPPFHQLDVRLDKRWILDNWVLTAYLDVQNVYNHANPEGYSYNFDSTDRKVRQGLPIIPVLGLRGEF
jgi:hypothetical protein